MSVIKRFVAKHVSQPAQNRSEEEWEKIFERNAREIEVQRKCELDQILSRSDR
jgi:hypothetical protein